ncbi:MAG: FAD-dependent oxidoreductase [Sorangiineae bacterium]|nr:FAD-dependent oxidoreductase [Polyangiaceae bacterium]MEB2321512.1 FAD-dependent oxidoreductase [Sorangiineae bacterium]
MTVVVVGGGVAGTAAAWLLAQEGVECVLYHERAGASALYAGAVDGDAPGDELAGFAAALGLWRLGPCTVASPDGLARPALGRDAALLDLGEWAGRRVAVADVARDGWDARLVARSLGLEAVPVTGLREDYERRLGDWDFAALHDEPGRAAWLAEHLARAGEGVDAWLVGPWLGTMPGVAARVTELAGKPVGETLSMLDGPAGSRFEAARDALLGTRARRGRVTRVARDGAGFRVALEDGEALEAEAVVLATGGVAAGGIRLEPPLAGHAGGAGFALGFDAPVTLELDGVLADRASTLHGVDFERLGRDVVERIGAVSAVEGLALAGDLLAGRPRNVLEAVRSGLAAARRVARAVRAAPPASRCAP